MTLKTLFTFLAVAVLVPGLAFAQGEVKDFFYDGPAVEIPDNSTAGGPGQAWVPIIVPDDGTTIKDVDVDILIEHTWQGDLIIEVEKIGGPRVPLLYRAGDSDPVVGGFGFSADNFGDPASGATMILDDEANEAYDGGGNGNWGSIADPGVADVTGSWVPYGAFPDGGISGLGAFDGLSKGGEWMLHVSDNATGDTGQVLGWSLHITNVPEPSSLSLLALSGLMFFRRRR